MAFYQNVFEDEFRGNLVLGDRQLSLVFKCPPNRNRSDLAVGYNYEPYDFSTDATLTLWYAFDRDFKNWASLPINVAGATPSATTAAEVITALNANATFADYFVAQLDSRTAGTNAPGMRPVIKTLKPKHAFKFYIDNYGAEKHIRFNKYAGLADMPVYFDRHTIANRFNYLDSVGMLIRISKSITNISVAASAVVTSTGHGLTTGDTVYIVNSNSTPSIDGTHTVTVLSTDTFSVPVTTSVAGDSGDFVDQVGYDVLGVSTLSIKKEWEQLAGRSGIFNFRKQTVDGSDRITQIIEYSAGSSVGDLGRKTQYVYSGANTSPSQITEIPYILQSGDLVTPP